MSSLIRPATFADIPVITRIYAHAVRNGTASFELEPPDEAEMSRRMKAVLDGEFPYFVAEIDGRVAGYAYASLYRKRPAYRFTVEDSVYVAPDAHRRGIGKALLVKLIETCTALGFRQMIAVIGDSNQAASIGVHEACGFSDAGNLRNIGWKFGRWLDTPLMQLTLGPGATTPPPDGAMPGNSAGSLH
ncbi:MAG TPA: GNAT family N-acetyltransferase [Pseudolabrys sp.]|jgi:phosphinothricin acetyltransferase|nr:GNAT family N-acetyltransferase [Pseudolabrys sp.]